MACASHLQGKFSARSALLLICIGMLLSGCGQTVAFNVVKAAKVNVPGMTPEGQDATVSVGTWGGVDASAAADIGQRIRELVTNAPGGVVKFAESNGVVRLDGEIREYTYSDSVTQEEATCSRYDESTKKNVTYPCTRFTRKGTARITVSMNVIDVSGKTVGADTYQTEVPRSTSATEEQPPPIPWEELMTELRAAAATQLAGLVVPLPVQVSKRWFKCGPADDLCQGALVQLRQGNFDGAQSQLRQAIERLEAGGKAKDQSAAWWGLTLAQEFSGDYAGASASLERAVALDPGNSTYAAEGQSIADMRSNTDRLSRQAVTSE